MTVLCHQRKFLEAFIKGVFTIFKVFMIYFRQIDAARFESLNQALPDIEVTR